MSPKLIATAQFAAQMRARIIRPQTREVLVSRLLGSEQENDLSRQPNAAGLGRLRHFRRHAGEGWPENPLPIDPARRALGVPAKDLLVAQVFQNAACAWRCWYCYVPFNLLSGDERRGAWVTADELIRLYRAEPDAPPVIDLSGGSPDLTPEWVVWTMDALKAADLHETTYLWSDDNLSTDYVFTQLSVRERDRLADYPNYGRVCCFKGFDAESFTFNTGADRAGFGSQFETFRRYLDLGIDLYGYITLTGPEPDRAEQGICELMDRFQDVSELLPLRVIPLRITAFGVTTARTDAELRARADATQNRAVAAWKQELARRFPADLRGRPITDLSLRPR